jgi:hypothetical protein
MTDFLYTDARWGEHFIDIKNPHKKDEFLRVPLNRTWVGLTEDEAIELLPVGDWEIEPTLEFAKAIEAKLKEKNT